MTQHNHTRLTEGAVDPDVYKLYLQAQALFNQESPPLRKQAIELLQQVTRRDPHYARAFATLALAYASLGRFYEDPKIVMPKAREAALQALKLDESLSEAHTALATVRLQFDWDWDGAETELKRAIQLNHSSADAHDLYAAYYTALGNFPSALSEIKLAREFDPLSLRYADRYLYVYVFFKHYDETIAEADKILAGHPEFVMAYAWKAIALAMQKKFDAAIQAQKRAVDIDPNPGMLIFLGVIQAAKGDKAEAQKLLVEIEDKAKSQYVCNYEVAQVYAGLGDRQNAFKWLNQGVKQKCDCMIWLRGEPWMESIRADKQYLDLIKRVGFDRLPPPAAQ